MHRRSLRFVLPLLVAAGACHHAVQGSPSTSSVPASVPASVRAPEALARAESAFHVLHVVKDRLGVTSARGAAADLDGHSLASMKRMYGLVRAPLVVQLAATDSSALGREDRRALAAMRRA
ncbi:MAG: hypothetical protein H0U66_17190, partial [Gemmatimonadaceae bacterium]|nr:hypothetical protein [Gemmatimonadaceae bacterium]